MSRPVCPQCGSFVIRVFDAQQQPTGFDGFAPPPFAQGTIRRACADCGYIIPIELPAPSPAATRATDTKPSVAAQPKRAPELSPATVLKLSKQRRRDLKREIAREEKALANKKREFSELSRLLDAAEAKPRAVVRPIRTTA